MKLLPKLIGLVACVGIFFAAIEPSSSAAPRVTASADSLDRSAPARIGVPEGPGPQLAVAVGYVQTGEIQRALDYINETTPKKKITKKYVQSGEAQYGTGACGGDLPSCTIMDCESGGDLRIYNKQGSGASGKWQITHGTWGGYGGYENAADAPEDVQDARAREIWAGGSGRGQWSC